MEFRHRPLHYPGTCSLKEQVDGVEHKILYLGNRIRGLEDALDGPDIDPTLRDVIEEEILALKAEIIKHKENVKAMHKDKSHQMAVITILIFIILCVFTMYRIFYAWY
ncbi:PREDICTED: uncharacterized protein LOC108356518 [Rhagoletis zephyria]|uniref:uncharacterized protein LOC108356518 n=1 Tax=Rhagoletis zephyria TaxID=28612 RepID=UPI00081120B5|nr:PREDICTED: uncharacterized protein LOC108356518 [Rhagoletis zephyria]